MRVTRRVLATATAIFLLTLAVPSIASADGAAVHGWWTQTGPLSSFLDGDVPADGLLVESSAAGDVAVAAVLGNGLLESLSVPIVGTPTMNGPVRACRLTGAFAPAQGGAWTDRPGSDCSDAVAATTNGSVLVFALTAMRTDGVVLEATGPADRIALGVPSVIQQAASSASELQPSATQPSRASAEPPAAAEGSNQVLTGGAPPLQAPTATQSALSTPLTPSVASPGASPSPVLAVTPLAAGGTIRRTAGTIVGMALLVALILYWSEGFGAGSWRTRPSTLRVPHPLVPAAEAS